MRPKPTALCAAALLACAGGAHAVGVADFVGDFLPTFAGSTTSTDLDVISARVTYNPGTDVFVFTSTQAGNVGTTALGVYVWGVNTGTGTNNFASLGLPGVKFNTTVQLRPNGTGTAAGVALPAGAVTISGATITGVVSGSVFTSTGFAKTDFTFNLWPRDNAFSGTSAISDFAPDDVNFTAAPVPEPQTWALMAAGIGLLAWRRRQRG